MMSAGDTVVSETSRCSLVTMLMCLSVTASMIMTGNSNGTVALYDVGKAGNKLGKCELQDNVA